MIKYISILYCFVLITAPACKSKQAKSNSSTFIDIAAYLKGQLAYLDTVPFSILKLTQADSVNYDTSFLKNADVRKTVNEFLVPQLEKKQFEKSFRETSFADATLFTITITYNAVDTKSPLQRIDVYVNPENNEIKQLYLIHQRESKDSVIVKQLLWKHNKNYTLISNIHIGNEPEKTSTEKVIWDETED